MVYEPQSLEWGSRSLERQERGRLRCGSLLVEYSNGEAGVSLASTTLSEEAFAGLAADEAVDWNRWAVCTGIDEIELAPALPDRPVLLHPEVPFPVAPGGEVRVFFRLPVWVVVKEGDSSGEVLAELPTVSLPQVRFGDDGDGEGERCYRLAAEARREPFAGMDRSGVQAPVSIRNESAETLPVKRLCLRVAGRSLYSGRGNLWTNETVIRYQGGENRSKVSVQNGAPSEVPPGGCIVAGPREPGVATGMGRTFRSLRRWSRAEMLEAV